MSGGFLQLKFTHNNARNGVQALELDPAMSANQLQPELVSEVLEF